MAASASLVCGVGAPTIRMSVQVRKVSRSRKGTPNSSQMTVIGSGKASASTRSARPSGAASIASRSSSVNSWTRGARDATRRAVKARATSPRSRVCCGALERSIDTPLDTGCIGCADEACRHSFDSRGSLSAARTSS